MTPNLSLIDPALVGVAGSGATFDDTDLKAYWKFDETSGDVIEQSESAVALGSSADIQITGATYEDNGSPLGTGMSFDGVDDFGIAGSSLSNFNFLHNTTALFTICFWAKLRKASDKFVLATCETDPQVGLKLGMNSTDFRIYTLNGETSDNLCLNFGGSSGFIPDDTYWYFYIFRYDQSLSDTNFNATRDNANLQQSNKTANTPSNANQSYPMNFARRPDTGIDFTILSIAELSIWNKIMNDADMTSLYNGGSGLAIY